MNDDDIQHLKDCLNLGLSVFAKVNFPSPSESGFQRVCHIGIADDEPVAFLDDPRGYYLALWASEKTDFLVCVELNETVASHSDVIKAAIDAVLRGVDANTIRRAVNETQR